ncbi:MAG: parallel beta-helix domain-containing protein [Balneolaceae bacterium]
MINRNLIYFLIFFLLLFKTGCDERDAKNDYQILQEKLITAQPGDILLLEARTYHLTRPLSLVDIDNVTIRGMGKEQTILSFAEQIEGAEGLLITANGITVEDLAIIDTKGDALKITDSDGVTIRNVHVSWTGEPSESNGAYGLYPVGSKNVLVEYSEVSGASDAGIYVGQSEDVIVRHNTVFNNVAGIEIENCIRAEVYANEARDNTGGILVFDLPELTVKNGRDIRIYENHILNNNYRNFAPEGNIVGMVPAGTGLLVMATDLVHVHDNEIAGHKTVNAAITSYLITQLDFTDPEYSPFPSSIYIYNNQFSRSPAMPDTTRPIGKLFASLFGPDIPDIIHDGVVNSEHLQPDGSISAEKRICIGDNGQAAFANINAPSDFTDISFDPEPYRCPDELFLQTQN